MAIATVSITGYAPPHTVAGLMNAISSAMATAGFTEIDAFISGTTEVRIWRLINDAAKTKGTVYVRADCTSTGALSARLYDSWDAANDSGSGVGTTTTGVAFSVSSSSNAFNLYIVNHPELKGVLVNQTTAWFGLYLIRPNGGIVPEWWNENLYNYCFLSEFANAAQSNCGFHATISRPWVAATFIPWLGAGFMSTGNDLNSAARDVIPLVLGNPDSKSSIGVCNDVVACASSGLAFGDTINNQYKYIGRTWASSGIAIRIA